jgi:UrcA family protein
MRPLATFAFATLALLASPALAEEAPSVRVAYGDLDLSAPAGRQALDRRLRGAANRVCGPLPSAGIREMKAVLDCRTATIAGVRDRLFATASYGQVGGTR